MECIYGCYVTKKYQCEHPVNKAITTPGFHTIAYKIHPSKALLVGSGFRNLPVFHDQNQIGIPYCGQAMCDDKACSSLHQTSHCFLDQNLSAGIYAACRLVKNQHGWICKHCPGNDKQLFLSLGQADALFMEQSVITIRYAVPAQIEFMEKLPRTKVGKIDITALENES